MCGIAGVLTARDDVGVEPALRRMVRALRHRGPDDEGWRELRLAGGLRLGLANTRLAILDLSPAGHQPMTDPESGSWIALNGEIYNHEAVRRRLPDVAFRSGSDTETVLRAWVRSGPAVLSSLRGMFGLALYDARREEFWLVRDRLGVKPLYAAAVGADTWVFASELRALAASGLLTPRINARAVNSYLAFGAVASPWTMLEGVESLGPGECWRFDVSGGAPPIPERSRYWRLAFGPPSAPAPTRDEAVAALRPVLAEAAALRTVADVPVAVFLSGGIDSASVVAALAGGGRRVHTFSVAFGERHYDESEYARLVARRFATEHTEVRVRPAEVLDGFEDALGGYDQPSIDGVNTWFLSRATRAAGIKVALSGIGGDELFAGYRSFRMLARLERSLPRRLARLAYAVLSRLAPSATRTRKLGALLGAGGSRLAHHAVCREVTGLDRRAALLVRPADAAADPIPAGVREELEARADALDPVNAQSLLELSLYLANMLLRDADQMSMAHGLELREPLLDHVLAERVAALPGALKLARGRRNGAKALLVDALPAELPGAVLRRRKMGFVFPWEHWLRRELRDRVGALLGDEDALGAVGLSPAGVRRLWHDFLAHQPGVRYTDVLGLAHLLHWAAKNGFRAAAPCLAG